MAETTDAPFSAARPEPALREAARPGAFLILARHGRPALDRTVRIDSRAYRDWWRAYDAGGLADGQTPPDELVRAAREAPLVVTSTLRRACETARAVCGERAVLADDVFVEAPLPPPPLPGFVRLRPDAWGVLARIWWWLGFSRGEESRTEAERRAVAAAEILIAHAEREGGAMLVAHGWFNRMMRPELLARGWRCVEDGGDGYWSFRRYERR